MKKDTLASANLFAVEGFSKLTFAERIDFLLNNGLVTPAGAEILLKESSVTHDLVNHFIENAIGVYPLPLGIAVNFVIDKREYVIPMATEETSIIAAASKTAKWIRKSGEIKTRTLSRLAIGQIQFAKVKNAEKSKKQILENKNRLVEMANTGLGKSMTDRGGGVKDLRVRKIDRNDGFKMLVVHVMIDTCDAMGANFINQICEFLKPHIEVLISEKVGMCILSNLTDEKITAAKIVIKNIEPGLGTAIEEASKFAELDPYRAATNNKGILNAIDSILLATGNDWRAVEAGMHAYAARNGSYSSLSHWYMQGNDLHGEMKAPIALGVVGGVTALHPVAKISLKMLGVNSADELARIITAVGLVQNLGALNALVTQGIIQGHLRLHVSNMAIAAGASQEELKGIIHSLEIQLAANKHLSSNEIKQLIADFRVQQAITDKK